jgi:phenylalanyl-tRNA synthetase alpha chain
MQDEIDKLVAQAENEISQASDLVMLDQVRVLFLGKKGSLTALLKSVSSLDKAQRPVMGQAVNKAKHCLSSSIESKRALLEKALLDEELARGRLDITQPGVGRALGSMHPVTQVKERVITLFQSLGFTVATGPEIEDDYHNFTALNIPAYHPARALQDTFYLDTDDAVPYLLRTHTSPVQIREMENSKPPFRIITPGRVFRCDSDQTHTPMFHQCEGLVVDKTTSFAELKGLLQQFLTLFFEMEVDVRLRPSYFPFTEPSAEVDIKRAGSADDWLEVMGCGMVHPNVLRQVNVDPDEYTGFAFGVGLDRLAMLRFGISDLRLLFENDLRFTKQF